ncbi:hypothetical protein [Pseudonocardia sp. McavD-2-B]|uniref:hypothetical protein n=1 Tax=Pseudonocardia sp. McavD-2-B TaxID=2954499 RepID=UPI00209816CD|nr:hypothetical protein [Pseudonocardia sp. McavD-2-B]MCO7195326.1 hypothetical protein [Pseudonocardia sp. McavD-2-B]
MWINGYDRPYTEIPTAGMRMSGLGRTRDADGLIRFIEQKHIHLPRDRREISGSDVTHLEWSLDSQGRA